MTLESTGQVGGFQEAAKAGGFGLGVANYPKLKQAHGRPDHRRRLAVDRRRRATATPRRKPSWQFVKFLSSPQNQATWHTGTGYFPTSKGALNEPVDVAWRKQFPQFDVAVKQLQNTPVSKATQGCLLGVMPQARKASEDGLEKALNGTDPKQAMTEAAASAQGRDRPVQQLDEVGLTAAAGAGPTGPLRSPQPR